MFFVFNKDFCAAKITLHSCQFLNKIIWQQKDVFIRKQVEINNLGESDSFQWKPFPVEIVPLARTIPFSKRQTFQWKPFLLVETIPFIGNRSF